MTVIIGLTNGEIALMGADSAAVSGWETERVALPKIFRLGPLLLGVAGKPRTADVLRYADVPDFPLYESPHARMVRGFVPWFRALALEHGLTAQEEGQAVLAGQTSLMVLCNRELFTISPDFAVHTYAGGYTAIGVGAPYALGALYAAAAGQSGPMLPYAMQVALQAAGQFCNGVCAPFRVEAQP